MREGVDFTGDMILKDVHCGEKGVCKEDKTNKEIAYQIANMSGVGSKSIFKLLEYTGNIKDVLCLSEKEIYEILDARAAKAFCKGREKLTSQTTEQLKEEKGIEFVSFMSTDYPNRLRNIPDPPFALYVKGKLPKEHKPSVAIIGARACSEYGKAVADFFGRRLGSTGIQIVSGMARGIDGIAQQGALAGEGETFAVLGCGVDVCYPRENSSLYNGIQIRGGIISEYAPGIQAQSRLFPARNRIISGLADLILVIEARKRSGTYITVLQALEQGKEVYAVPGRITDSLSDGCNYLLSQGAGVAVSPDSVIEELSNKYMISFAGDMNQALNKVVRLKDKKKESGVEPSEEDIILSALEINPIALEELHDRIKDKSQIDISNLLLVLTKLQINGRVMSEGNYYRLINAL